MVLGVGVSPRIGSPRKASAADAASFHSHSYRGAHNGFPEFLHPRDPCKSAAGFAFCPSSTVLSVPPW